MEKMKKFSAFLHKVVDVASKVFFGVFIACLVFVVLVPIFGQKVLEPGSVSLDLDYVKLYLAEPYQTLTPMLTGYIEAMLLAVAALCFAVHYGLKVLTKVLEPMKEGRPFDAAAGEHLNRLSWVILIGGAATQVLGLVSRILLTQALPVEAILTTEAVTKLEFVFDMDLSFVAVFCLVRLLAYVFHYGQTLQQQADETL